MVGFSPSVLAERLTRAAWLSLSGITPSKTRAPSKTEVPCQKAWLRGPMSGGLPSCQPPSSQVHVSLYQGCDCPDIVMLQYVSVLVPSNAPPRAPSMVPRLILQ